MEILLAQTAEQSYPFASFLPMIIILVIIYFMILRPQSQQRKKHLNYIDSLKKGDKIITRGGLIGTIKSFQGKNDSIVLIDVGSNNSVTISRAYIAGSPESNLAPQDNT